jgi:hypothetical protein
MEISLALIIDELGLDADVRVPEGLNPKFRMVELFIPGETRFSPDELLVCPLTEALAVENSGGAYFLCCRDDQEAPEDESLPQGIAVVRGDVGLRELFNRVLRVFATVAEWITAMEQSVSKRNGLQELLDLSEPIFRNFIIIQDSTFKLVCYTKNIEIPSAVMGRLVRFGYHPPETMVLFRKHRRLEQFNTVTDILISRDRATSVYDIVKKSFHLGGSVFIMVVMDCCGKPANKAVIELFGMLVRYIKSYTDLDIAQTGGVAGIKTLAVDILDKSAGSPEEARIRSTYCGYPFDGSFRLYVFSFEDIYNIPTAHLIGKLSEACADSVALAWMQRILLIEFERAEISETCKIAEETIGHVDFICGISNVFDCLWALPEAHEQAMIAADVSSRLKPVEKNKGFGLFSRFSDNLIYHFISSGFRSAPGAVRNSFIVRSLAILREYDSRHNTETVKILRLFLENERSATATAEIMHMHRNTVLYHIGKISSLLGLPLDDPDARLQLLLAFKADDFSEL